MTLTCPPDDGASALQHIVRSVVREPDHRSARSRVALHGRRLLITGHRGSILLLGGGAHGGESLPAPS
jgi:hypothetical protein